MACVRDVAQLHQRVVDERVVDDVKRHGVTRFNGFDRSNGSEVRCVRMRMRRDANARHDDDSRRWRSPGLTLARSSSLRLRAPREVSLVITNGIVVTVDGGRSRHQSPAPSPSTARDIVAVDTADAIAAQFRGARDDRRQRARS